MRERVGLCAREADEKLTRFLPPSLSLDVNSTSTALSLSLSPSFRQTDSDFQTCKNIILQKEKTQKRDRNRSHGRRAVGELSNPAVKSAAAVAAASHVRPLYLSATIRSRSLWRSASIWALEGVVGALEARTEGVEEEGGGGTIGASTGGAAPCPLPPPPPLPPPSPPPSTALRARVANSSTRPTPRAPKITTGSVRSEGAASDSGKTRRRRASTAPPTSTMELTELSLGDAPDPSAAADARRSASCAPAGTLLGMFSTMRGM